MGGGVFYDTVMWVCAARQLCVTHPEGLPPSRPRPRSVRDLVRAQESHHQLTVDRCAPSKTKPMGDGATIINGRFRTSPYHHGGTVRASHEVPRHTTHVRCVGDGGQTTAYAPGFSPSTCPSTPPGTFSQRYTQAGRCSASCGLTRSARVAIGNRRSDQRRLHWRDGDRQVAVRMVDEFAGNSGIGETLCRPLEGARPAVAAAQVRGLALGGDGPPQAVVHHLDERN